MWKYKIRPPPLNDDENNCQCVLAAFRVSNSIGLFIIKYFYLFCLQCAIAAVWTCQLSLGRGTHTAAGYITCSYPCLPSLNKWKCTLWRKKGHVCSYLLLYIPLTDSQRRTWYYKDVFFWVDKILFFSCAFLGACESSCGYSRRKLIWIPICSESNKRFRGIFQISDF